MSYVTGTTHYNLPQTVGTDKRDWADTNQAFADIDAAIYGAVEDVATASTDISGLKDRMDTAEGNITQAQSDITGLDGRLTTAEQTIVAQGNEIGDVKSDTQDMICAYNEPTATSTHDYDIGDYFRYNDVLYRATQSITIGDTIVPDTNCTTTNVTTEILNIDDLSGDVTQLQTDVETLKNNAKTSIIGTITNPAGATYGSNVERIRAYINDNNLNDYLQHLVFIDGPAAYQYTYTGDSGSPDNIHYTAVYLEASNPAIQTIVFNSTEAHIYGWFGSSLIDETSLTHATETITRVQWV